jgi:hypothetical protein
VVGLRRGAARLRAGREVFAGGRWIAPSSYSMVSPGWVAGAAPSQLGVAMLGRRPGFLPNWKIASPDLMEQPKWLYDVPQTRLVEIAGAT